LDARSLSPVLGRQLEVDVLTPLLLAAVACMPPTSDVLIGFWESRNTSKGGIGHSLEFRPDGTAVSSTTVIVNMFYRTEDDALFVGTTLEDIAPGTPAASRFKVDGDNLLETRLEGQAVRKERLGARRLEDQSIVGTWRYEHYTTAEAYERYTADGRLLFRLPMSAYEGCYVLVGGQLSMSEPTSSVTAVQVDGDELLLARDGKEPFRYGRVVGGPWYPRDPEVIAARARRGAAQQ
jgi:hypothetical protein